MQKQPLLSDFEIDAFVSGHWNEIRGRACAKTARTIIRNRRLRVVNIVLLAAVVVNCVQAVWSLVLLARLEGAAASVPQIVRMMLS